MKRMHIHVGVTDLDQGIGFYSALFGAEPDKVKADYARWLLDDPRVNFAISSSGENTGVEHLGLQVETEDELAEVRDRLKSADLSLFDEGAVTCCYANSVKSWVKDPGGVAWESFHTTGDSETFSGPVLSRPESQDTARRGGCC